MCPWIGCRRQTKRRPTDRKLHYCTWKRSQVTFEWDIRHGYRHQSSSRLTVIWGKGKLTAKPALNKQSEAAEKNPLCPLKGPSGLHIKSHWLKKVSDNTIKLTVAKIATIPQIQVIRSIMLTTLWISILLKIQYTSSQSSIKLHSQLHYGENTPPSSP